MGTAPEACSGRVKAVSPAVQSGHGTKDFLGGAEREACGALDRETDVVHASFAQVGASPRVPEREAVSDLHRGGHSGAGTFGEDGSTDAASSTSTGPGLQQLLLR